MMQSDLSVRINRTESQELRDDKEKNTFDRFWETSCRPEDYRGGVRDYGRWSVMNAAWFEEESGGAIIADPDGKRKNTVDPSLAAHEETTY
ncbi:hypothetical protein NL676_037954 [Syzygium grande]|nr:hypothetical protein NL676_037954 [Syzygium grande]